MEDPLNKVDPGPMPQSIARLYPTYIVLKAAMASGATALGFGILWMFTRMLTMHAIHALVLAGMLHFSLDRIVLAILDNDIQKKQYQNKNSLKRVIFFYILSVLACRSIGPLFFTPERNRFHFFSHAWTLARFTVISCFGTLIVGIPYMPYGIGYMKASAFPLLRNPYQMFISRVNATFVPDDAKIISSRRFLGPTLVSTLSRIAATSIFAGIALGTLYNWSNPAVFILWTVSSFVESLFSSTQSELDPNSILGPWEEAFAMGAFVRPFLARVVAYSMLSILFSPGIEGICIYFIAYVGSTLAGAFIRNSLIDHLDEPLRFMASNTTESKQVQLFHRCILEDSVLADEASKSPPQTAEPNRLIKFEMDLYLELSEQYVHALRHPSKLTEDELVCDLLKLSALKAVAQADSTFGDGIMPPKIIRAVCVLLGGLGRHLSLCKQSADGKRLIEWHLPPTFFLAARYCLQALRLQLSKQRRDLVVHAPVGLNAIHHFVLGVTDFQAHAPSTAPNLEELKTMCEATAKDIIRATDSFETAGIRVMAFQDRLASAWVGSFGSMNDKAVVVQAASFC